MKRFTDGADLRITTGWAFHTTEDGERTAIVFSVRNNEPVMVAFDNESLAELSREMRRQYRANIDRQREFGWTRLS